MKKSTTIWLIAALVCIVAGASIAFVGRITGGKGGVYINQNGKLVTSGESGKNTSEAYTGIKRIVTDLNDTAVRVRESDNNQFYVTMQYSDSNNIPEVTMENSTITVRQEQKGWHIINFNFFDWANDDEVVFYVPRNIQLTELNLATKNGAIESAVELDVDYLGMDTRNGSITVENVSSKETNLETANGTIECDGSFEGTTEISSKNGKIICAGTYDGNTMIEDKNGRIEASGTFLGTTKCETSNGAVRLHSAVKLNDYSMKAKTSNGSVRINGNKVEDSYTVNAGSANHLELKTSNGSIEITD